MSGETTLVSYRYNLNSSNALSKFDYRVRYQKLQHGPGQNEHRSKELLRIETLEHYEEPL
jgi:hypothetical protein